MSDIYDRVVGEQDAVTKLLPKFLGLVAMLSALTGVCPISCYASR